MIEAAIRSARSGCWLWSNGIYALTWDKFHDEVTKFVRGAIFFESAVGTFEKAVDFRYSEYITDIGVAVGEFLCGSFPMRDSITILYGRMV